jgi:methylase of polypeptide subunit release factors
MGEAKLAFGHGSAEAYDEAAYLLLHALHLPLDRARAVPRREAHADEREKLRELFTAASTSASRRRISRTSMARRLPFYVDERVDHPALVHRGADARGARALRGSASRVKTALDMCTGSGCLAILMAHAYPDADIDAVDISVRMPRLRRAAQRERLQPRRRINLHPVRPLREPSGEELRPRDLQPAVRRAWRWRRCRTSTSRAGLALSGGEDGSTPCACW